MRLLIVEDNKKLCEHMKQELFNIGYAVDTAYTGIEGEEKAYTNSYDLILLDLNLPDKDGLDILNFLRKSQVETPVIIVTARGEVEERALGLDIGADDYLTKPFQLVELRARVQAVIRRFYRRTNPLIETGSLSINPLTRVVTWHGQTILLSAKEFDILEYIASRHPEVVSSEDIIEHVYDEDHDPFSSVLRVHLTRLRKKLSAATNKEILMNHRGKGYHLCVD